MLIKFESKGAAPFEMLGEHATLLIKLLGQGNVTEGSISGNSIAEALASLESGLGHLDSLQENRKAHSGGRDEDEEDDEDQEPAVSLRVRAAPLKALLEHAARNNTYVMWRPA